MRRQSGAAFWQSPAMASDLSIQPRPPFHGASESPVPVRAAVPPTAGVAANGKPAELFANPGFRFDPAAGLVVIEFLDNAGKVTDSIPSQRQLDAYRSHLGTPKTADGKITTG